MPLVKIHVLEGQYNTDRLDKVSAAIQAALMNTLGVPAEDFYQLVFEFPRARFRHTPSFVGMLKFKVPLTVRATDAAQHVEARFRGVDAPSDAALAGGCGKA